MFEKFTRIDSELTRTTRGTGLGLFIVKGLVETMGGHISLNADNGFTVRFTIPIYKGDTPTKVISNHTFTWTGWDKEIAEVEENGSYENTVCR